MQTVKGIIQLSEVKRLDLSRLPKFSSGIKELDKETGGHRFSEMTVVTGKRGQGKSTIVSDFMNEAVNQGYAALAYSGELAASNYQFWAHNQMAGRKFLDAYHDKLKDQDIHYVNDYLGEILKRWYKDKYFLFDNTTKDFQAEQVNILKVFENAHDEHGCRVFMIDNLLSVKSISPTKERDFFRAQSEFVTEVTKFCKRTDSHVFLVAHPRKTNGEEIEDDDIAGTGDIVNLADNLYVFKRHFNEEFDSSITVKKNRMFGDVNKTIGLKFDKDSKRYAYWKRTEDFDKQYGWHDLIEVVQGRIKMKEGM